ncbi:MAG TPA: PAS domain S-box protein [Terriglobales bacterium]|nr:PAS domain S-box protein [Terriglobales bacterium]
MHRFKPAARRLRDEIQRLWDFFSEITSHSLAWRQALAAVLLLFCGCLVPRNMCAQVKPVRRVLIFYELGLSSPSVSVLDQQIRAVLEESPFQIELYREYLETTLFPTTEAQQEIREGYIHKYRDRKPDLIMTLGPSPLRFLVDFYEKSFKGIPVVFGGLSGVDPESPYPESRFTGVLDPAEPAKTLEVGLRLQPGTKHVFVVGGKDKYDLQLEAVYRKSLASYESKLDITYLTDLAMPELLARLRNVPESTIILMSHIGLDAAGTPFVGASQADPLVVKAANAPVFGVSDVDLGHGEVGGYLISFAAEGRIMGEMAIKILKGQTPQNIPIVKGANLYMFDWRALKRWGLKEKNLPPDSIVLNRQPTFWEAYKEYALAAVLVLLAQTVAIFALLWQRAQRRKARMALVKSEEKFSKAFQQSPLAFTLASLVDYRFVEVNDTFERYTGWKRDEVIGRTPVEVEFWVDTNQRTLFIEKLRAENTVQNQEILFRTKDGQVRTGLLSSEMIEVNGEPCALSLIADVTEAKQAEEARREIEERFRLIANTAPVMIWMSGPDKLCTYFNQTWLEFTGRSIEAELGNGWMEGVHEDDLQRCLETYTRAFDRRESYKLEYRLRRKDGEYRWVFGIGVPRFKSGDRFAGYIGSCIDITERKLATEALSSVGRRLIQAQEQERTRIARELHDDINQRVAILAIELDALEQRIPDLAVGLRTSLDGVRGRLLELGTEIQGISHRLHSSKLEYLGLVAACRSFCKETAERHKVTIDFDAEGVPRAVPQDISLCLFRVLQESLTNAIKHSGTQNFEAQLRGLSGQIQLTIRDHGVGFDGDAAMNTQGLGLISMRERVSSVGGTLQITSKPMGGTEIGVSVPLVATKTASQTISGAA